ncbi:MAG: hypothetical protein HC933_04150 [Pleurocapsa sp. SU_196_0]|nr:hypothetical protein [Pleurocapsa sp. SU_196_0]
MALLPEPQQQLFGFSLRDSLEVSDGFDTTRHLFGGWRVTPEQISQF